ncbi:type IV pilin protein [Vibrio renipiscarius]|uniref:Fimbrial protein n=1 Tax=Vibrio renipiscarius TaxID=1461322 RepID=A0A0C2K4G4_9VIBR|nr:type IV pilin protein [Vibrio renipiscarius]KII76878.1 fimbrial protein [Vibrio renipiscarius]KII77006.1 fimbrial protein [Vibrio renipiscarius]
MIRKFTCNKSRSQISGMTLIELLVVVGIVGILIMFAYPSYQQHTLNAHRATAQADLAKLQLQLEHDYDGGYDLSSLIPGGVCTLCESDSTRYSFKISSTGSQPYIISANALSTKGQDDDSCLKADKTMTLDSSNTLYPSECWD